MDFINIQEAKTHLSRLVEQAAAGREIVIAKAGRPIARLVPFQPSAAPRMLGALAGQVVEKSDCWETDTELESLFYGDEGPIAKVAEQSR